VTVRDATIRCEIKDEYEGTLRELDGRDLDPVLPWCIPRTLKNV